jgi:acyl-CoA thioesterase FadM
MARTKLIFPAKILGEVSITVRITDINYGNHLGNDALVSIIHEARVKWLYLNGYTELNIEGAAIIMGELLVNYLGESFYGDELKILLGCGDTTSAGFELYYDIETNRNGQRVKIAIAKTGLVFYDYQLKKVSAMPEKFKRFLQK